MPFYIYHCPICKKEFEEFRNMEDRHKAFHCGTQATICIQAPAVHIFQEHYNVGLGQRLTSQRQKKEVMRKLNCEEVGNDGSDKIELRRKELIDASHRHR